MKKLLCMMLVVAMSFALIACGQTASTPAQEAPAAEAPAAEAPAAEAKEEAVEEEYVPTDVLEYMSVASSSPGGAWYPINVAHGDAIQEMVGTAYTLLPGGSRDNVIKVNEGEAEMGICHTIMAYNGYNGNAPYEEKLENVRYLTTLNAAGFFCAVRKDSGITKFEDLVGKNIGFYPVGNLCNTIAEQIFDVLGYTLEDLEAAGSTISYLAFTDGPGQLADGQIDCYVCLGTWPPTVLQEIDYNPGIDIVEVDDELFAKLDAKYPGYSQFDIPKGTFQSVDRDIKTVGAYCCLVVNKDMTDDMAYVCAKALWDNIDKIKEAAKDAHDCELETALNGCGIPIHPGAEKYYKEVGLIKD